MFICKEHTTQTNTILCIIDKELLGKTFEEGIAQLDLNTNFFKGMPCTATNAMKKLSNANTVIAIGKHTIQLLIKNKIIEQQDIKTVQNIPHAQIVQY